MSVRPFPPRSLGASTVALAALTLVLASMSLARPVTPRGELTPEERVTIDVFEKSERSVVYIATSERVRLGVLREESG